MCSMEVWVGRAGSGKSYEVLQEIAEHARVNPFGPPIWWVVPSGASYATERVLLSTLPATVRVEVMTLNRLAERVMEATGQLTNAAGMPLSRMNRTAKRIIMAQVYEQCRPALSVFQRDNVTISFLDALLQAMAELDEVQVSLIDKATVDRVLERSDYTRGSDTQSILRWKWQELWRLKESFDCAAAAEGLWDGDLVLPWAASHLAAFAPVLSATLYFDGFSALTDMEVAFVLRLAAVAQRTVFTLSAEPQWFQGDGEETDNETPYAPQTLRLWNQLQRASAAVDLDVVISRRFQQSQRFVHAPALSHLERNLFRYTRPPFVANGTSALAVHVAAAQNPRIEVLAVLQQIEHDLQVMGLSYAEIAVITPNLKEYLPYIKEAFDHAGVPYTTDDFPVFSTHPLARLLTAVLDAAETGLIQSAALRVLKTEFPGIPRDEADWLEAYVRRYDVPSTALWDDSEPWLYAAATKQLDDSKGLAEDARANDIRLRWSTLFKPVVDALKGPTLSPVALARALWSLLETVGARRKVATWMVNQDGLLTPLEASLHEQAWDLVMGMLNDFASAPAGTVITLDFARRLLTTAINEAVLSTIPGHVNSVLVTEVGRAEGWDVEVVFVLGASDGSFPTRIQPSGVWLDDERSAIATSLGRHFGLTTEQRQWDERKTVYQALTRARKALWVTYPMSGSDGKSKRSASVVGRIKRLFVDAGMTEYLWTQGALWNEIPEDITTWNKEAALAWFAGEYRQLTAAGPNEAMMSKEALVAVGGWLNRDGTYRDRLRQVLHGARHRVAAQQIAPELAERLFRGPSVVSVSQLETYAACPYQHFLKYGLRVADDLHHQNVEAAARGTLVHAVLQHFVERASADLEHWRSLSDEQIVSVMRHSFEQVLGQPEFVGWARSSMKMSVAHGSLRVLERAAVVLTEHARHSAFQPKFLEFTFGDAEGQGPSLQLPLPTGGRLALRGRIDRVDVAPGDEMSFRILDYKSSPLSLDLTLVWHGLQLQLPVYAAAMEQISQDLFGQPSTCAGVFYLPILRKVSPVPVPLSPAVASKTTLSQMRAKGYFMEDMTLIDKMDDRLVQSEDSPLFTKVYNKDGTVTKRAPVLGKRVWRGIFNHSLKKTYTMAREIGRGQIDIRPYRLPVGETACQTCSFRPICHIDPRYDQTPFRRLNPPEDVVERYANLSSYDAEAETGLHPFGTVAGEEGIR